MYSSNQITEKIHEGRSKNYLIILLQKVDIVDMLTSQTFIHINSTVGCKKMKAG